MPKNIFDVKTCSICKHMKICKTFEEVSNAITAWDQFDVRLSNVNRIYDAMADMCKHYKKM